MGMFNEKKKLMVVYEKKDEMPFNYLKKLIETDDDDKENNIIVGSEDDSVSVIGWTEKVYLDNKKKGNISNKTIFLDDVKGVSKIAPIMDKKFDKFGISYGFAGNQAVISIDETVVKDESIHNEMKAFFEEYYKEKKFGDDNSDNNSGDNTDNSDKLGDVKKKKIIAIAVTACYPVVGIPFIVDAVKTNRKLRDEMFLFAITKFYLDELDAFMKD